MPRMTAEVIAPPTPWTKRAATSTVWLCASPHSSEAAVKIAEADHEDALAAEQVAEASGEQQQAAEGDQIGVDDPREARLGEAEVALDRRQRDVHDGGVEHDHQHPHAEHVEGYPAVAVGHGGQCSHAGRGWSHSAAQPRPDDLARPAARSRSILRPAPRRLPRGCPLRSDGQTGAGTARLFLLLRRISRRRSLF